MALPDLLILGAIATAGFLCQWLAWKVKLPAILFLLLTGIILGPITGLVVPDQLFGDLLFPFISLAVAIILFEGSLTLKKTEIKEIGPTVRNMVSYGALVNMIITTLAVHYFVQLSWSLSALFGAIMVVTGPTVIMPMLRSVRPNERIAKALRWEGIIIDPLGALFAVLVFEWIIAQQSNSHWIDIILVFGQTVITGTLLGLLSGHCLGLLLRHHCIPEYLHNFSAIAFVIATFSISNTLMHESGLLAVTIMGIWLTNMRNVHIQNILNFKENLTILLVSGLFIILSARINMDSLMQLGVGALAVLLVMQFIARPLKVFLSTIGSQFTFQERILLAWIGPRGIVAAAVAVVFAIKLEALNIDKADLLVPLAFCVIIGTVAIQSTTARMLAKKLNINEPDTQGFLIIGANPLAIAFAKTLQSIDVKTVLCDEHWENISMARMENLNTYYGNPLSAHAELHMDLSGINNMLGLSPYHSYNTAAALHFREKFGMLNTMSLAANDENDTHEKHNANPFFKGRVLFNKNTDYRRLERLIEQGLPIKNTLLSETYPFDTWQADNPQAVPLFSVDQDKNIHWFTSETSPSIQPEWRIFAIYD